MCVPSHVRRLLQAAVGANLFNRNVVEGLHVSEDARSKVLARAMAVYVRLVLCGVVV